MIQSPSTGEFLLKWRGDKLRVTLTLDNPRAGRAAFRTNLGNAKTRRREIIAETERGEVPMARAWHDLAMNEVSPGVFAAEFLLDEVGVFSGKACFFAEGSNVPEWPDGANTHIKVESAEARANNTIYTVFPRQFGSFREIVRRLDFIMGRMGFRIIQTLPPFPVPTTYAVMGEYGCPFAATDFLSVDPAMAEFDEFATPLMQFKELIGAVHARRGLMFVDLPANHTGWASTLQTHHPEWFRHETDGRFHSPGAWGVKWADLVELDYANPELRAYMAEVFLFWCRIGIDGFRCDAGYMIPQSTWVYIVARVREEYPDTVFMLEGLGGRLEVTDALLAEANLDWAYSEIFQTYNREQFEWYLPSAITRSEKFGTLVHFAETHDNDRLAKRGETYARLRVQLAALLSWQGAWGIANGVEWLATEKIDVHGRNDLNWGASNNLVDLIANLNRILATDATFAGAARLKVITRGGGNVLAVLRQTADATSKSLVLANLDCEQGASVDWDRSHFAGPRGPISLAPGEVRYLKGETIDAAPSVSEPREALAAHWHIEMPRDEKRDVVVPAGELVEVTCHSPFRMRLIDPATNRTVRVFRSPPNDNRVCFDAPRYHGEGTACRRLWLDVTRYENGRAIRSRSWLVIPPAAAQARVRLTLSGATVRRHPEYRAVLANRAGAAAQLRAGWGEIYSQYDAILAANPNATCPSDRQVLWTRTRIWLQREGYVRELDRQCITSFAADPRGTFARWCFRVPCGMGREAAFVITLALAEDANAARMLVERVSADSDDVGDQVRLVFRPDVENRSFHATTKAYQVEQCFQNALEFRLDNCVMHEEGVWTYNVAHPEEAERGQDGSGDLYSPGWISTDLKVGDTCAIVGVAIADNLGVVKFPPSAQIVESADFATVLKQSLELYVVRRDDLKTVIAGYPWFLDWGRDTFIFMRGMIAAGMREDARKILHAFAAFEEHGTLPNIIYGKTAGNRDTVDAQLWFIRCVQELGADELRPTCESIIDHYLSGTPNGIRVDRESALVWTPAHFTWMDTNYPACTPRCGYPVEIQALWISALRYLGRDQFAAQALASVQRFFKGELGYADCLDAPQGESAAAARPDFGIRPNQLFLITLGILDDREILRATERLLVPGGIRTLASEDSRYRGVYTGDENTSRKPAYHNGTVWAWPFPLYAEALMMTGAASREVALSLLASAVENLNAGTLGHLSECADGDTPHAQKACTAQAWSDSELLRVFTI